MCSPLTAQAPPSQESAPQGSRLLGTVSTSSRTRFALHEGPAYSPPARAPPPPQWAPPPLPTSARWASTFVGITGSWSSVNRQIPGFTPDGKEGHVCLVTRAPGPNPSLHDWCVSCLHLGAWRTTQGFVFISRMDSGWRTWSWEGHTSGQTLGDSGKMPAQTLAALGPASRKHRKEGGRRKLPRAVGPSPFLT